MTNEHQCWTPAQGSIPAMRAHPDGHDWRLHERTYFKRGVGEPEFWAEGPDPSIGKITHSSGIRHEGYEEGHREVWYCTRCRKVEERET